MDATAFEGIKYGNVIQRTSDGRKFMVQVVTRGVDGKADYASLMPAIGAADAPDYTIVSTDHQTSYIQGHTIHEP